MSWFYFYYIGALIYFAYKMTFFNDMLYLLRLKHSGDLRLLLLVVMVFLSVLWPVFLIIEVINTKRD
jgi:hypothetical protein